MSSAFDRCCCPHHPEASLIEDYIGGDMVCLECGLVVGDRATDVGSEWRDDNGGGEDLENTFLGGGGGSGDLSSSSSSTGRAASFGGGGDGLYTNRTLIKAFKTISNMCDRINLPKTITDRANTLFKMVYDGKSLKGRSNYAIASACLYIACRQEGVPRTFKEIVAVSTVSKKEMGTCFKLILKAHDINVEIITTGDFMHRFCGALGLHEDVQNAATQIAKRSVDFDIVPGRSPISVAAAAIYMASQASSYNKKTQKEIADIAGVADVTIRQSYKLMLPRASELFPEEFKFLVPIGHLSQN